MPVNGISSRESKFSVDQTVARIKDILEAKSIRLFAEIDHSGEAAKIGMSMRPTKLLIFGNPKAGTPVMQAAPTTAIDLPLKLLVWQDAEGKVWISANTADYLRSRHGFSEALVQNLAAGEAIAAAAAE